MERELSLSKRRIMNVKEGIIEYEEIAHELKNQWNASIKEIKDDIKLLTKPMCYTCYGMNKTCKVCRGKSWSVHNE
jgi:transcription initiation factor IIE alpha subunit